MEALDLRYAPPRGARAELAGVVFMARTVDKMRASLPGGHLGDYALEGFSERMLQQLGMTLSELQGSVRFARSEEDVADYVAANAKPGGADVWNAFVAERKLFDGDRAKTLEAIPWLADHPEVELVIDYLDLDDRRSFPAA